MGSGYTHDRLGVKEIQEIAEQLLVKPERGNSAAAVRPDIDIGNLVGNRSALVDLAACILDAAEKENPENQLRTRGFDITLYNFGLTMFFAVSLSLVFAFFASVIS